MSTISGSTSSTSGSSAPTTAAAAAAAAQAAAAAALHSAAESIIGSATGDSSLDATSLISSMVTDQVAGQTAELSASEATDNAEISAFGQLQSALSSLGTAIAPLYDGAMLTAFSATASGSGLTATAGISAVPGSYSVDVTQIATAQSLTSTQFSSTDADSLGTGSLTISVGSKSMTLNVPASDDSLSDLASSINAADDNPGLTASVVTGDSGQYLVLTADSTGSANTISISASSSSSTALQNLDYSSSSSSSGSSGTSIWSQTSAAQDAKLTVNGVSATSASNTITSIINGVTLNLTAAAVDTSTDGSGAQTLTVATDTSSEISDVSNFVTAYNSLVSTISALTAYNPTSSSTSSSSSTTGPLLGNSLVTSLKNALGNIVGGSVSSGGTTSTLASFGVTLNNDGTLSLDTTTLDSAVTSNPGLVQSAFNLTNGFGAQLNNAITPYAETDGLIDSSLNSLTSNLDSLTTQTNNLTAYANELTTQYQAKFTALDALMTSTNNDEEYLTDLFGNANNAGALFGQFVELIGNGMAQSQTHADQTRLVNEVYALTLEIDTAVNVSDWQRAAQLAAERSPKVHAIAPVQSPAALALIRSIQTLDAARRATVRAARGQLSEQYRQSKTSVGAARQYLKMARLF